MASGAAAATPPNADKVKLLSSLLGVGPKADAALGQSNPMAGAEAAEPSAIDTLSALGSSLGIGASQPEFLDPDIAFQLDTELRDGKLHAHWSIADAYYLYRNKFAFKVIDDAGDILGAAEFVPG